MDIDRINKLTTPKGEVVRIKRKSDGVTIWRKPYLKLYDWITLCGNVECPNKLSASTTVTYTPIVEIKIQSYLKATYGSGSTYTNYCIGKATTSSVDGGVRQVFTTSGRYILAIARTKQGTTNYIQTATIPKTTPVTAPYPVYTSYLDLSAWDNKTGENGKLVLHSDIDGIIGEKENATVAQAGLPQISLDSPLFVYNIPTPTVTSVMSPSEYGRNLVFYNLILSAPAYTETVSGDRTYSVTPYLKLRPAIKDDVLGLWDEVEERIYPCASPSTAIYGYGTCKPEEL